MLWWHLAPWEWTGLRRSLPPEYEHLRWHRAGKAIVITGDVEIPTLNKMRRIAIIFRGRPSREPVIVMAHGPTASRHRYRWARPTSLCIWFPSDPHAQRWTYDKGLAMLVDLIRMHLLREMWWRTTQRWDAPEVHDEPTGTERQLQRRVARVKCRTRKVHECWCSRRPYSACHGAMGEAEELDWLGLLPTTP
jgi:hypothetical protein